MKRLIAAFAIAATLAPFGVAPVAAQSLYARDGTYLGEMNNNQYDQNSINNPYGNYGSKYSPNSINNPYSKYGNKYSDQCVGYRCNN